MSDDSEAVGYYLVYCYDPPQDKWTTLPALPVKYFGLGHVNSNLVAVGGLKKTTEKPTNDIYTYDAKVQRWKQTIPSMPTARSCAGVLSLQSALVVLGGGTGTYTVSHIDVVEIFRPDMSQWYKTCLLYTSDAADE